MHLMTSLTTNQTFWQRGELLRHDGGQSARHGAAHQAEPLLRPAQHLGGQLGLLYLLMSTETLKYLRITYCIPVYIYISNIYVSMCYVKYGIFVIA